MTGPVGGSPRIRARLDAAAASGRPLVIPYLTAGYPELDESLGLIQAAERAGADMIEIGLPFSDPLADGPVIQAASQRALERGMTHRKALDLVRDLRRSSEVPLIFMGYYNPILNFGLEAFFEAMREVGVDGLIVPDLPFEESPAAREAAERQGISLIFLIAPTTPDDRLALLDGASTDFSYCVSVTGVTGAREEMDGGVAPYLDRVKKKAAKPFVVGFGISRPEQMDALAPPAVGVVIGSALLRAIGAASDAAARKKAVGDFVGGFATRSRAR